LNILALKKYSASPSIAVPLPQRPFHTIAIAILEDERRKSDEDGFLLEYMLNGSIADYLYNVNPQPSIQERLKWAMQAAEAVTYIHTKDVLHCDIGVGNLFLDKDLDIRLCDF